MKTVLINRILVTLCVFAIAGCASRDYKKGHVTAQKLERTSRDVQAQTSALETAMASLNDLVASPAADLRPQIKRFRSGVNKLEAAANRTLASATAMRHSSTNFFHEWDVELGSMSYQVVRDRSEVRKVEVSKRFDLVCQRCAEAQEVVYPLISYLRDIERALGTDLTLEGLNSLKPIVANANQNAEKVESALGKLSDALADAGTRMSPIIASPSGITGGMALSHE